MAATLEEIFELFDFSRRNRVAISDVPYMLECAGYTDRILSVEHVHNMQLLMDPTHLGYVSFEDFQRIVRRGAPEMATSDSLWAAFRMFDVQNRGIIALEDLIAVACIEVHALTEHECRYVMQKLTSGMSRRGMTFEDFKRALQH
jgi:Ca2+-binding EF-hand superfamily protein